MRKERLGKAVIDEAAGAAIDRVWKITWRYAPETRGSDVALMREYLRRSALVAEALGLTRSWPWYDAAGRLTLPDMDARLLPGFTRLDTTPTPGAQWTPLEQKIMEMDDHLSGQPDRPSILMRRSCLWYVRWESIKSHPALAPLSLPELYEPLIVMYERGGWFNLEHGYIDLRGLMIGAGSLQKYLDARPALSLDPQTLDLLDEAREREQEAQRKEPARKTP